MILLDANLLLYAKFASFHEHKKAKAWLDSVLNSNERVGIPWESIGAFIRIATNPRIFEYPLPMQSAWDQIKEWLSGAGVWTPQPTENHLFLLQELISFCSGNSGLIYDAHLAAIANGHGLTVYSTDSDFARFPNVRWGNPLR